jgi:hypothetical protein
MLSKTKKTGCALFLLALVLIVCWAVSFFGYDFQGANHLLLIVALIVILFLLVKKRDEVGINRRRVKSDEDSKQNL